MVDINGENIDTFIRNLKFVLNEQESVPSKQTGKEWAHDLLLEYMTLDPTGEIRKEREEKREVGLLKFICHECGMGDHDICKARNERKKLSMSTPQKPDCDCGHKKVVKK